MNSPLPEQPSTRQVLLVLGVICASFILILWLAPSAPPRQTIWNNAWQLERFFINGVEQNYRGVQDFTIKFIKSTKLALGSDGCNSFWLKLDDEQPPQTLKVKIGEITLLGCLEVSEEISTVDGAFKLRAFSGVLVLPYLDRYRFVDDKLIFTSSDGNQEFVFRLIGPVSGKALDELSDPSFP